MGVEGCMGVGWCVGMHVLTVGGKDLILFILQAVVPCVYVRTVHCTYYTSHIHISTHKTKHTGVGICFMVYSSWH